MTRTWTTLLIVATSVLGQGRADIEQALVGQLTGNMKAVTIDPGQSIQVSLSIRPQTIGSDTIVINTSDPAVEISVRLPNGATATRSTTATDGFQWQATVNTDFAVAPCRTPTHWISVTLPDRQPVGDYVVQLRAPTQASRTTVCVSYFSIGMGREGEDYEVMGGSVKTDRQYYQLGDPVVISVPVIEGGQPVRNAQVQAVVSYQDNVVVGNEAGRLQLTDASGTGNYTGVFVPTTPHYYNVSVTITGRTQREGGNFFVVPLNAKLLSTTLATPAGRPQARMQFQVYSAGEYKIQPTLRSVNGMLDSASIKVNLTPGQHLVTWEITANELRDLGMRPPYELTEINVVKTNPQAQFGADAVGNWVYQGGQWQPK